MTVRQDKPIPVWPNRVFRVKLHDSVPDRVDQRRERHWRAGMSGFGLLHRINREGANCVYR